MPPEPTGTIAVNEPGPYHWQDTLTFATTGGKGRGHPMVELAFYQDTDASGEVDEDLFGKDLVFVQLDHPEATFTVGHPASHGIGSGGVDESKPAEGRARLLQYSWKGGQQTITELDSVEIDVEV